MKPLWAQMAAGALICAVVAALALLPAKLLGPEPHGRPLALPATIPVQAVRIALPPAKPHHVVVAPRVAPRAQVLAAVRTPIVAPVPVTKPARQHHVVVKVAHAPLVTPHRLAHPRLPKQELRPKPKPAPAPTVTAPVAQAVAPTPAPQFAAPAQTTSVAVPVPVPQPSQHDHGKGHGHGHGHDR